MCVNTPGWLNGASNHPCATYAKEWCDAGMNRPGFAWTLGAKYNFPEKNCCACGKGAAGNAVAGVVYTLHGDILSKSGLKTQPDAQKFCENLGGNLATIMNKAENEAVAAVLPKANTGIATANSWYWTSLHSLAKVNG